MLRYVDADIAQCAYGGPRPNPLRIRGSVEWLAHLAAPCPGNHQHVPWKPAFVQGRFEGFGDAQAKGIPVNLAKLIAATLRAKTGTLLAKPEGLAGAAMIMSRASAASRDENRTRVAKASAAANWQSRGRRLDQLIREFRQEVTLHLSDEECEGLVRRGRLQTTKTLGSRRLPKDSQVLSLSSRGNLHGTREVVFGVPWTPCEFFGQARSVEHPFGSLAAPRTVA